VVVTESRLQPVHGCTSEPQCGVGRLSQIDFTTQFETVYDLLSEDGHGMLRQVLSEQLSVVQDTVHMSGVVDHEAVLPPTECPLLFLVCRMKAASSTRRISSVSVKTEHRLKVDTLLGITRT